jgi:hypothetical protein
MDRKIETLHMKHFPVPIIILLARIHSAGVAQENLFPNVEVSEESGWEIRGELDKFLSRW